MSDDVRYKMQHLGDIFVDALSTVVDSAQKKAKGVVLAYDIRDLNNKRVQCFSDIGRRIIEIKKTGLADLKRDGVLMDLFSKARKLDQLIESYEKKKREAA
jgi:hypothetical protein